MTKDSEVPTEKPAAEAPAAASAWLPRKVYESELAKLNIELVKLQEWIKFQGLKAVILFEGRDAAGKGGVIKTITAPLNPRYCRVVALGVPTERERTQWYFQRYVAHLPSAGEMVLCDRSWYNRALVEHVMGFCTEDEYREFLRSAPEFERMLVRSGIILIKYWFSVSDDEQERIPGASRSNRRNQPMDLVASLGGVPKARRHVPASDASRRRSTQNADDKRRAIELHPSSVQLIASGYAWSKCRHAGGRGLRPPAHDGPTFVPQSTELSAVILCRPRKR
jgi:polyphosphate kinase 2